MVLRKRFLFFFLITCGLYAAQKPFIQILGIAQDAGYPHIACSKPCCTKPTKSQNVFVVSFALVDPEEKKWWLFEATPNISNQLNLFEKLSAGKYNYLPEGIFISHAHIGHYTGLMYLGREAMGAKEIPVYCLNKLSDFISNNGPWSQLVSLKNISLQKLNAQNPITLTKNISVNTFTVPHRDEFSETAGFKIITSEKKYLFIPDIDKWEKWDKSIVDEVKSVDVALLDATFFSINELPNRSISEVPHPFVSETMLLFEKENVNVKLKIHFIHFNHTNPLLWDEKTRKEVKNKKFNFCLQKQKL